MDHEHFFPLELFVKMRSYLSENQRNFEQCPRFSPTKHTFKFSKDSVEYVTKVHLSLSGFSCKVGQKIGKEWTRCRPKKIVKLFFISKKL